MKRAYAIVSCAVLMLLLLTGPTFGLPGQSGEKDALERLIKAARLLEQKPLE